jgi:hypothetical protein
VSAGNRTFIPALPQSWVTAWRNSYLQQNRQRGSILQVVAPLTVEQQRQLRFGPCWDWWNVPPDEKALWWERDGQASAG